jgi:hypothetical protein
MTNRIYAEAHDVAESSKEMVGEHPVSATLIAFGIGLGIGVLIGTSLAEPAHRDRTMAEKAEQIGREMVDAMMRVLPESMAKHMHR